MGTALIRKWICRLFSLSRGLCGIQGRKDLLILTLVFLISGLRLPESTVFSQLQAAEPERETILWGARKEDTLCGHGLPGAYHQQSSVPLRGF